MPYKRPIQTVPAAWCGELLMVLATAGDVTCVDLRGIGAMHPEP